MARLEEARAQGLIGDVPAIDIAITFAALTQGLVEHVSRWPFYGRGGIPRRLSPARWAIASALLFARRNRS